MQNAGGCFPPPPGYFQRVREICDRYDVLLVSDEVICAFGRLGEYFGAKRFGYQPDIITVRQGPDLRLRAARRDDRLRPAGRAVPARAPTGSPTASPTAATRSAAAVALANLDIFEREDLNGHVRANSPLFRSYLERLYDLPIVGDVRGDGYFFGIELVKDKATKETFNDEESERAAARLPVQGALRGRALLPRRRPRRPGDPAGAAADLRREPVRRDRADPAFGADRGMGAPLAVRAGRTRIRRLPELQVDDPAVLHGILDAGMVAQVAIVHDGQPYAIPVAYGRSGSSVLFHGSTGSRLFRALADGAPCCFTVTLLDGLVLARSAFETSMHYRSVMALGSCTVVEDKLPALQTISEHLVPGDGRTCGRRHARSWPPPWSSPCHWTKCR